MSYSGGAQKIMVVDDSFKDAPQINQPQFYYKKFQNQQDFSKIRCKCSRSLRYYRIRGVCEKSEQLPKFQTQFALG